LGNKFLKKPCAFANKSEDEDSVLNQTIVNQTIFEIKAGKNAQKIKTIINNNLSLLSVRKT
jgi:flagellar motor component MotA